MLHRLLPLLLPALLPAQIHLTTSTALVEHAGHAQDELSEDRTTLRPGTSREYRLDLGADRGIWRAMLSFSTARPDLVVVGGGTGISTSDVLALTRLGVAVGPRILGGPDGAELHLMLGATINRWTFEQLLDPDRSRYGASLAAEGALPLSGSIRGVLRLEGGIGSGVFATEDLPEGYRARGARYVALGVGLRWQR